MTALQLLILSTIHAHGAQSDMALWGNTKCQSLTAICLTTIELENGGLIQRSPFTKNIFPTRVVGHELITYWQLTEKGRQLIAGRKEQEVSVVGTH